jgi:hypothetical protein
MTLEGILSNKNSGKKKWDANRKDLTPFDLPCGFRAKAIWMVIPNPSSPESLREKIHGPYGNVLEWESPGEGCGKDFRWAGHN